MDITIEHQVKKLKDGGYKFTDEQKAVLKKYSEIKQNRYDCGNMFELEEDEMIVEKHYSSLDDVPTDTVRQAEEYVKRYSLF